MGPGNVISPFTLHPNSPPPTCGTLLELLVFLFPPLPGLEDAPQGGQLAVASDGWSVHAAHQATRSQHPLLVQHLYCSHGGDNGRSPEEGRQEDE